MTVEIKITGENAAEAVAEMAQLLGKFIAKVEDAPSTEPSTETKNKPKKARSKPKQEKPEPPTEQEEPSTEQVEDDGAGEDTNAKDKDKAITILMDLYTGTKDKDQKAKVTALLKGYGVKKFTDVPTENGTELLEKAVALQGEMEDA